MGPCIVTADELPDPGSLRLRTFVNDDKRQDASNRDWLFPMTKTLVTIAHVMTLEPGDVVTMGTPGGCGLRNGNFMKPGDVVRVEVDGIGHIENRIVAQE
jgi:2-keto-4-pentenoate hydratase/2-oxohepta-3-ene-1,7-dioic acid hydratase in catechol pathway